MRRLSLPTLLELNVYLLLLSIPISVPLTRIAVKLLIFLFILNLIAQRKLVPLRREDLVVSLMPLYQSFALLIKGEVVKFLRAPNGIVPVFAYLIRFIKFDVVKGLNVFIFASLILGVTVILQALLATIDYRQFFSEGYKLHFGLVRPWHTLVGHPLTAGAVIAVALLFSVFLFVKKRKFSYLFAGSILFVAEILTFDRSYWLATLFTLFLTLSILRKWKLIVVTLLAFSLTVFSVPELKSRFFSIFDLQKNVSNLYRLSIWQGALNYYSDASLKAKVTGTGREGYKKKLPPFLNREVKEHRLRPLFFSHLHNNFITVLIWYGLLGLIIFILTFFYFIFINLKAFFGSGDVIYLFFFSAYVLLLFAGLFEYNFEDEVVKFLIYALFGMNVNVLVSSES